METKKETIQEKRERLKLLSNRAQEIREDMLHNCKNDTEIQAVNSLKVNDLIISNFYKDQENQEFKSFKGWMKEGFAVQKGQKAFLVWGRPKQENKKGEVVPVIDGDEEGTFFPVSFIFSNAQVKPLKNAS